MSNKKRILICGILPPPNFGHSMMYHMLMNSSFVNEFDITFLNMSFWSYGKHKKVTIDKLLKLVKYYVQFVWLVITKRPEVVLYNMSFYKMPFLKDFIFCLTGKILGVPFVIHDMGQYLKELYDHSSWIGKKLVKWYTKHASASIIMGEKVRPVYEGFMPPEKLFIVPGCVEDTKDLDVPVWKRKDDEVRVLYFSFMSESKGIYTAFNAVSKVVSENSKVQFIFAGPIESDQVRGCLDDLMKTFPNNVRYLGYIEGKEKRTECFRNSDIFIFPTHRDVFGLVLLHAMAEGVPIVASREGTIPEIINDGESGFLFEKEDDGALCANIMRLVKESSLRGEFSIKGRERFQEYYTSDKYGERMVEVFYKIEGIL